MTGGSAPIAWQIDGAKIDRYLLNASHPRGASKAKYLVRFGFTPADPGVLARALVEHALGNPPGVATVSPQGIPLVVFEGTVQAPDGRAMPLRTVWEPREPREMHFVTAVPLTR